MSMIRFLALGVFLVAAGQAVAAELRVRVTELRIDDGGVHFALYATPESFPKKEDRHAGAEVKAKDGGAIWVFRGLAPGRYAVAVYHDENGNGEFDQGFFGIPLEGYAFSNGATAFFSAPGFDDAAVTVGDDLLAANYPAVHAVGRAATRAPRLIDLTWGAADAPKLTLVGKGVCFDSGGLDLKPASGMKLMKKDMGGAALVLGLAGAVMGVGLDVRLRVLVPAVENAVAGNALRPLDVIATRKGITVEVGNTDAEGRLILCDALAEADSEAPDLIVDCATLTGAARVALGPDVPALYTPDDALAADLLRHAAAERDPLWRMPLWRPYREMLDSKVADINNIADGPYAGSITAALFLEEFVSETRAWAHLDMMAWNLKARPGRPVGGEAMGLRALYAMIVERFAD